jgi:hypothetical protein
MDFDTLRFDCDFILPSLQEMSFQTKDFFNQLDTYVVSKEGRLFLEKAVFHEVPENKQPYYGTADWYTNPFVRLIGSQEKEVLDAVLIRHDGLVDFTGYIINPNGNDMFYNFQAGFSNGVLEFITLVDEQELDGHKTELF